MYGVRVRIFLDIGAHFGETLEEVLKEKYAFDRIICFEPSVTCLERLEQFAQKDSRVEVLQKGLSNSTGVEKLYNAGKLNGSIFLDGDLSNQKSESIKLVDASTWYSENIEKDDFVVIKTNCEGSEVQIVDSFLKGGTFEHFYSLLITFDIRDYPSLAYQEIEIRKRLEATSFVNFCFSDDVMIGPTHEKRIENWLTLFGVDLPNQSLDDLRKEFSKNLIKFSSKSGKITRLEISLKRFFNYQHYPAFIKNFFRLIKRLLRLNRERSIDH